MDGLASSPEAILQSLVRRSERLRRSRLDLVNGVAPAFGDVSEVDEDFDDDEFSAEERERLEEQVADAATSARTLAELDAELAEIDGLIDVARRVRHSGTDRKWSELRTILRDQTLGMSSGTPRKLIIFTEHRDTLHYLDRQIGTLLGKEGVVQAIHGGVDQASRRAIVEEFTKNPDRQICSPPTRPARA